MLFPQLGTFMASGIFGLNVCVKVCIGALFLYLIGWVTMVAMIRKHSK